MTSFQDYLVKVVKKHSLTSDEAADALEQFLQGRASPLLMGAFLTAETMKGEHPDEIVGFVRTMRQHMRRITPSVSPLLDVVGTGGDGKGTFNISTAAAFVAAGAGAYVAKHGNRAASGVSGSADVLEALGVHFPLSPSEHERQLRECHFTFLFAPHFHPAMKQIAPIRKELGFKTFFNLIGPLLNPAGVSRYFIGVHSPTLLDPFAHILQRLGVERAVLCASDTDEVSLEHPTSIVEVTHDTIRRFTFDPCDLGFSRVPTDTFRVRTASESAARIEGVLRGMDGPFRDIVVVNAGVALYAAGIERTIAEGVRKAQETIDRGAAFSVLEKVRGSSS